MPGPVISIFLKLVIVVIDETRVSFGIGTKLCQSSDRVLVTLINLPTIQLSFTNIILLSYLCTSGVSKLSSRCLL